MCIEYDRTSIETFSFLSSSLSSACIVVVSLPLLSWSHPPHYLIYPFHWLCLRPLSSWSVTIHSYRRLRPFFFSLWSSISTSVSLGGCHVLFPLTLIWYHWFDLIWNKIKYPLKPYRFQFFLWYDISTVIDLCNSRRMKEWKEAKGRKWNRMLMMATLIS